MKSQKELWKTEQLKWAELQKEQKEKTDKERKREEEEYAKLRSRGTYGEIASMLKNAKKIEGIDESIRKLTLELYNHKPNLPALKDEFRKAALV